MITNIGLWIDHREAIIVTLTSGTVTDGALTGATEAVQALESGMEKHVRFSSGEEQSAGEDTRDRRFTNHLNLYYQKVIEQIRTADAIFIFGPGEAKGELVKRLESENLGGRVLRVEPADKLTESQIAAKVHEHFASPAI
jgi:hypothetical protein